MRAWLALALVASPAAFARPGSGSGNAEYQQEKSLKGFCSNDNKEEPYFKQGYCLSMVEQFRNNPCTKSALAELRARFLADEKDPAYQKVKEKGPISLFSCSGEKSDQDLRAIAKSQDEFNYLIMQYFAMLTTRTSGWNVLNNEQAGGKGPGGLLQLSLASGGEKDMENKEYACGCKEQVVTTSGQSNVTVEGQSPGPLDGHHSLTCGSYMMLHQILKDGSLGGGQNKGTSASPGPKKDSRTGIAKILAFFEEKRDDSGEDPEQQWRNKKMETFCNKYWSAPSSRTNRWDDAIGTNAVPEV